MNLTKLGGVDLLLHLAFVGYPIFRGLPKFPGSSPTHDGGNGQPHTAPIRGRQHPQNIKAYNHTIEPWRQHKYLTSQTTRTFFSIMSLPSDFLNGFASAAFQVEGAAKEGGRGLSIWDEFCATPGRIADGSNADVACDSYHKWRQDIALLKQYGTLSLRW
jgi:Glycosyl hydrolase family 1